MKKDFITLSLFFYFSFTCFILKAQNTWTQKADFGGTSRMQSIAFSINSKGYIGTGVDESAGFPTDFWEYNPSSNTWTQKANFTGIGRRWSVGFSIGSKGYIGTGYDGTYKKDFWEYDPSSNTWTQKADFGGSGRYGAVGFGINNKGYIGTGFDGTYKKDFWEYDPSSNTWTQKADFGGDARIYGAGFAIGSKGYIGTGNDGNSYRKDFWEYNPSSNTWTQKADFGGSYRDFSLGFNIGSVGYIGTGRSNTNYTNDFWEYNPSLNTWDQQTNFGGTARDGAVGFGIGDKGYIGTGLDGDYKKDFWEFRAGLSTNSLSSSSYCSAASLTVSFKCSGISLNSGNVFTAQLSSSSGNFASPTNIGTLTSTATSGNINATIPSNVSSGTAYRIRVVSSNPTFIGTDNGSNITIINLPADPSTINMTYQSSCIGGSDWDASFQPYPLKTGVTYLWSVNGSGYFSGLPYFNDTYPLNQSSDASITLNVKYQNSCGTGNPLTNPVTYYSPCGAFRLIVSPNPVNDILQIEQSNIPSNKSSIKTSIQSIEIIDKMGRIVYKKEPTNESKKILIYVGDLKDDIYIVRIFNGKEWGSSKFLIRH